MALEDMMLAPSAELKADAREQLQGKWGTSALTYLVYSAVNGAAAGLAGIGTLIVGGPLDLGLTRFALKIKRERKGDIEDLFTGFSRFEQSLVLYLVRTLFIVLWSMLLIIPGIIASLRYSMAFYILHDNPEMSGMEALRKSGEMMVGYKGRLFGLYLSFIGWGILCMFTFGIGFFWLIPYVKITEANFYERLKSEQQI